MLVALVGAECEENLAIRYIRGALEHAGHTVVQIVFNARHETERAAWELAESGARLAGFSMVFTYRAREFVGLMSRAREFGFRGYAVAGGHFAAFNAEALLADVQALDAVAVGEGEEIMCSLAGSLDRPGSVRGLVWRDGEGETVRNGRAPKLADLDVLPYPTRKSPPGEYLGLPIANMLSSRGCTHACGFCSISAWHRLCGGERFRARNPVLVADEIASLYGSGYRLFNFHDDNFILADRDAMSDRLARLERALCERGVGQIGFAVKSRPDSVDRDLFARMRDMGLFRAFVGVEAGTREALRNLGRTQTVEQNERAIETLLDLDLHVCFNLLLLNPDSTLEDFSANVAFLRRHDRNPVNFCRAEVYAGTPLEGRLRREGRLQGSYWGHGYRIRDDRAQLAFEIMCAALYTRHHGEENIHHLAMRADYERQLLTDFYGCPNRLCRKTNEFVRRVNRGSCGYLEEIAASAARGFESDRARQAAVADLARRIANENALLTVEGDGLIIAIRDEARRRRWGDGDARAPKAAAAGLAAALVLAVGGTTLGQQTHMHEMVAESADKDPEVIRDQVATDVLTRVVAMFRTPVAVTVFLRLDEGGAVKECTVAGGAESVGAVKLPGVAFKQPKVKAGVYRVSFTVKEVALAMQRRVPPPDGDAASIRSDFRRNALPVLGPLVLPAQNVDVELWTDGEGRVYFAGVYRGGSDRSAAKLDAAETAKAAPLIEELGAGSFARREEATAALKKMGRGVLPLVRRALAETDDPEISVRCGGIIREVDRILDVPQLGRILESLRGLAFKAKGVGGRRFLVPVTKTELEQHRRRVIFDDSHICEMIHAPLD